MGMPLSYVGSSEKKVCFPIAILFLISVVSSLSKVLTEYVKLLTTSKL